MLIKTTGSPIKGQVPPKRWRAGKGKTPLLAKKSPFFAWLNLHHLDLLCLADLVNPWNLHFFAVILRPGNFPNTEAAY
jgi:hypothetical protein